MSRKFLAALLVIMASFPILLLGSSVDEWDEDENDTILLPVLSLLMHSQSVYGSYSKAAVSSDDARCSILGRQVLETLKGNAVDAAIAMLFCIGIVNPHASGIGGGSFMTIYNPIKNMTWCIDGREVAPIHTNNLMPNQFDSDPHYKIGVPGEVSASHLAHTNHGQLPWNDVVRACVDRFETGSIAVSKALAANLKDYPDKLQLQSSMRFFFNETGHVKEEGDFYVIPNLNETLKKIAEDGTSFYKNTIATDLLSDLDDIGSIIRVKDLKNYAAKSVDPVKVQLGNFTLYSHPPPAAGGIVAYILNIFDKLFASKNGDIPDKFVFPWISEAIKHGLGKFVTQADASDRDKPFNHFEALRNLTSDAFAAVASKKILDSEFSTKPVDYGAPNDTSSSSKNTKENQDISTHISVVDENGMAVVITSSLGTPFGSGYFSEKTGIILNNNMMNFDGTHYRSKFGLPPTTINYMQPKKRPQSTLAPTIVVDSTTGKARLVVGGGGHGPNAISSIVQTIIRNVYCNLHIKAAIDEPRFFPHLSPMNLFVEKQISENTLQEFFIEGIQVNVSSQSFTSVNAVTLDSGKLAANADYRVGGEVEGYHD